MRGYGTPLVDTACNDNIAVISQNPSNYVESFLSKSSGKNTHDVKVNRSIVYHYRFPGVFKLTSWEKELCPFRVPWFLEPVEH